MKERTSLVMFFQRHAVRLYAVSTAVVALVLHFYPSLPGALLLGVVAAVLGVGEATNRTQVAKYEHEDAVNRALYTTAPEIE